MQVRNAFSIFVFLCFGIHKTVQSFRRLCERRKECVCVCVEKYESIDKTSAFNSFVLCRYTNSLSLSPVDPLPYYFLAKARAQLTSMFPGRYVQAKRSSSSIVSLLCSQQTDITIHSHSTHSSPPYYCFFSPFAGARALEVVLPPRARATAEGFRRTLNDVRPPLRHLAGKGIQQI